MACRDNNDNNHDDDDDDDDGNNDDNDHKFLLFGCLFSCFSHDPYFCVLFPFLIICRPFFLQFLKSVTQPD